MNTIDNLMALHDAAAKAYAQAAYVACYVGDKQGDEIRKDAKETKEALRAALTEALAQQIDTSQEHAQKSAENVQVPKALIERALQAISASIFGTDTYKVSSRGDFASTVEKELRAALAQPAQYQGAVTRDKTEDGIYYYRAQDVAVTVQEQAPQLFYMDIRRTEGLPEKLDKGPQMLGYSDCINGCMIRRRDVCIALTSQLQSVQPAREPLSDEQVDRISKSYGRRYDFARAIQAAHGIGVDHWW